MYIIRSQILPKGKLLALEENKTIENYDVMASGKPYCLSSFVIVDSKTVIYHY